jgi:hypothetical protein
MLLLRNQRHPDQHLQQLQNPPQPHDQLSAGLLPHLLLRKKLKRSLQLQGPHLLQHLDLHQQLLLSQLLHDQLSHEQPQDLQLLIRPRLMAKRNLQFQLLQEAH